MRNFWYAVYNAAGVPLMWIFFRIYSLFNSKVREGLRGRRDLFIQLGKSLSSLKSSKRVLIHSSSLGEFQQAMPFAEEFARRNYDVILSFFSPSGFNNSKFNIPGSVKCYLPFDSHGNQKKFLGLINPDLIVFMRYDLWYNFLFEAKKRNIATLLVNARFDEKDIAWKIPVARSFKKHLYEMIDRIFVIDEFDRKNYAEKLDPGKVSIVKVGDSKFQRVYQTAARMSGDGSVLPDNVTRGKKIFVMGSSWKDDEEVILPAVDKALRFDGNLLTVLVPHEPKETKITAIEKEVNTHYRNLQAIRYSQLEKYSGENLIIIDRIGMLSRLYASAVVSYVGGGFKTGLHNILEPAIFNMPILFSNAVKNSDEDEILLKYGCGIVVTDTKQFYKVFRQLMSNDYLRDEIGKRCRHVFTENLNVAEKIVGMISEKG